MLKCAFENFYGCVEVTVRSATNRNEKSKFFIEEKHPKAHESEIKIIFYMKKKSYPLKVYSVFLKKIVRPTWKVQEWWKQTKLKLN